MFLHFLFDYKLAENSTASDFDIQLRSREIFVRITPQYQVRAQCLRFNRNIFLHLPLPYFAQRQQTLIRRQHDTYLREIFGALSTMIRSAISSSVALQSHSKGLSSDATQQETSNNVQKIMQVRRYSPILHFYDNKG